MVTIDDTQRSGNSPSVSGGVIAQYGLEASLSRDREATLRWVDEAPLRLVASVLIDSARRTARVSDIKTVLTQEVIESQDWNKWWNIVRFGLSESRHFSYAPRELIRLRTPNPAEIDSDSLDDLRTTARRAQTASGKARKSSVPAPSIASLGGWILWVQADEEEPMPRSVPPADFVKFLRRLPGAITPTAISRLTRGISQRLLESKQKPAEKSIEMWQESLVSALTRWSELADPPRIPIEDIVALTARALEALGQEEFKDIVVWIAAYASKSGETVETVSGAMLSTSREAQEGTERLLTMMDVLLASPVKIELWQRLLRSGLVHPSRPPIGRWLRVLGQDEKPEVFSSVFTEVRDESTVMEMGSLLGAEWRLSDARQRRRLFDAVALGWVLHRRSLPDARSAILEAVAAADDEYESEGSLMSEWRDMVRSASEDEVRRVREDRDRCVGDLERRLKETEAELDRVGRQARFLEGENRAKRSNAELEISRDAITVLSIALQSLAGSSDPKPQEIADLEASITLALSTLGATPVGEIGKVVPFDPVLHEADASLATGTPVMITALGLRYSRRGDTPINLVKAIAQQEE